MKELFLTFILRDFSFGEFQTFFIGVGYDEIWAIFESQSGSKFRNLVQGYLTAGQGALNLSFGALVNF